MGNGNHRKTKVYIGALLLLLALAAIISYVLWRKGGKTGNEDQPEISIKYYYMNPCESCNEAGKFYEQLERDISSLKDGINVVAQTYNTFQDINNVSFIEQCSQSGVLPENTGLPAVWINDTWISGKDEIDKRLQSVFTAERAKLLDESAESITKSTLLYFYISPCNECSEARSFLDALDASYPVSTTGSSKSITSQIEMQDFNINEKDNLALIHELFDLYRVPSAEQKVPIVFLKNSFLSGAESIRGQLVEKIKSGEAVGTVLPSVDKNTSIQNYDWPAIVATGLINGLNPCSLSMLLFLIAMLLTQNRQVLIMGLSYITGKTLAYLAIGTVLYTFFLSLDSKYFEFVGILLKIILLLVVVGVMAISINDFFAAKNEKYNKIIGQLPVKLRQFNHAWITKGLQVQNKWILIGVVILLGIIVSAGEFLCTGQIFLSTIIYLARSGQDDHLHFLAKLILYIAAMQIPMLILTFAAWKGREVFHLSEFVRKHMPLIKLLNAFVFLIFFIVILVYY